MLVRHHILLLLYNCAFNYLIYHLGHTVVSIASSVMKCSACVYDNLKSVPFVSTYCAVEVLFYTCALDNMFRNKYSSVAMLKCSLN